MLCVRERGDELSSVPWSRLRRPGSLPASLAAAAAMAHSPVQAGLPGMQVSSCPKGRHGHAPRAGVGVKRAIPGWGDRASGGGASWPWLGWGQRSGMETSRAVSAWRGAGAVPPPGGSVPASAAVRPSVRPGQPLCGCGRAAPSPGRDFSALF